MTLAQRAARIDPRDYPCQRSISGPWPCSVSSDPVVWRLWHSLAKRAFWGALSDKGRAMGLEWKNCRCGSTLALGDDHGH